MKAFRFMHAADLHLDSPFAGMTALPQGIRESLRQSTFLALTHMVQLAIQQKVDFILISGDVFDLADRSLRAQIRFQKAMQRLSASGIAVYIVHGNHDPEDGLSAKLNWPAGVHFFSTQEVEVLPVVVENKGEIARIYGISYATAAVTENLVRRISEKHAGMKNIENVGHTGLTGDNGHKGYTEIRSGTGNLKLNSIYKIGLVHTNVDGDKGHANYAPCSMQDLLGAGMDYWALGHVHTRQLLHTDPPIVYPGNLQGRSVRETGAKGCYIVDVTEYGEAKLTFHALDAVRWQQRSLSIQGIQTEQELKERLELELEQAREEASGRAAIVRISLTGRGSIHASLQKGSMLQELITELREDETSRLQAGTSRNSSFFETNEFADKADQMPTDYVWIESVQVNSGLEIDKGILLGQESFLGDLLRLSETILTDEASFAAFCSEALDPLFAHGKAAKHLAELSLAERQEWLKAAQEMAIDYLAADAGWDE
jgi:exonuclease SbcD